MDELIIQKVLITGGCGFIGLHLVDYLTREGFNVTVLDLPTAEWGALPPGVSTIKVDLLDDSLKNEMLKNENLFDFVFHLAARTDLDGKVLEDYKVNYQGTKNLINALGSNGSLSRFVLFSTQLVCGIFNEKIALNEETSYRTKTLYGESKILAELACIESCKNQGINYTILRPTSVYGPKDKGSFGLLFGLIKSGRYFHIGSSKNLISVCFVKNLCSMALYLATYEQGKNEIFFASEQTSIEMREFTEAIANLCDVKLNTFPMWMSLLIAYSLEPLRWIGVNVPLYPRRLKNIVASYTYDMSKVINTGFHYPYDFKSSIIQTLESIRDKHNDK
jgi:nucleoside-diphosphate-sugar epimerase